MPLTHLEAHDQIRSLFWVTFNDWITNGEPINIRNVSGGRQTPLTLLDGKTQSSYVPLIQWDTDELEEPNDLSRHWLRMFIEPFDTQQTAFRNNDPSFSSSKATYTEQGIVTIQCFFSKSGFGNKIDRRLTSLITNIFRPRNESNERVWYRSATPSYPRPRGKEAENWRRSNVTVNYEFDEQI